MPLLYGVPFAEVLPDLLFGRSNINCPPGTSQYVCKINNFDGCCWTDPCNNEVGCPPQDSSSASASAVSQLASSSDSPASTTATTSSLTPASHILSTTITATTAVKPNVASTLDIFTSSDAATTPTTLPSSNHDPAIVNQPTSPAAQTPTPSSPGQVIAGGVSKAALVGGIVGPSAVLVLLLIAGLGFMRLSKRRKRVLLSPSRNLESGKPASETSGENTDSGDRSGGDRLCDFFATAGREQSPSAALLNSPSVGTTATAASSPRNAASVTYGNEVVLQLDSTSVFPQAELTGSPPNPLNIRAEAPGFSGAIGRAELADAVAPPSSPTPSSKGQQPAMKRFNPHRPHVMSWANYDQGVIGDCEISPALGPSRGSLSPDVGCGEVGHGQRRSDCTLTSVNSIMGLPNTPRIQVVDVSDG